MKMLPSACGLGQHFQDLGLRFSLYGLITLKLITFEKSEIGHMDNEWQCYLIHRFSSPWKYQTVPRVKQLGLKTKLLLIYTSVRLAVSNWSLLCFSSKVLCQLYSRWYNRHDVFYKAFLICSHKDSFQHASCLTVTVLRSGWFDLTTRTISSAVICFVVFVYYLLGIWEGGWQVQ